MAPEEPLVTALLDRLASLDVKLIERREEVPFGDRHGLSRRLDASVHLRLPDGHAIELAIEVKRMAYPRDIRAAVETLRNYEHTRRSQAPEVPIVLFVAAGHLTAGSREMLLQEGINYFDSSGTLYFRHATWLVDIDRPPRETSSRRIGSLFAGAREQVVHAMLVHWHLTEGKFPISGAELAHMAATSTYTVSRTLQEMERLDWLQTTGSGPSQRRLLSRPAALLDAWAAAWTQRSEVRSRWYAYAPRGGIVDVVLQRLVGHEGWAITGAAAANAAVPHLSVVDRVVVIVAPGSSDVLAGTMQLKSADKGHNVILVEREGASLLFLDSDPERPGSRFASPFVQYLDLLDGVGRNKELASELRRQVLKIEESDVG